MENEEECIQYREIHVMRKAVYIDTFSYTTTHEMFNASLLSMCSIVFDNVTYLAGKDSSNNVTRIAENIYEIMSTGDTVSFGKETADGIS